MRGKRAGVVWDIIPSDVEPIAGYGRDPLPTTRTMSTFIRISLQERALYRRSFPSW